MSTNPHICKFKNMNLNTELVANLLAIAMMQDRLARGVRRYCCQLVVFYETPSQV